MKKAFSVSPVCPFQTTYSRWPTLQLFTSKICHGKFIDETDNLSYEMCVFFLFPQYIETKRPDQQKSVLSLVLLSPSLKSNRASAIPWWSEKQTLSKPPSPELLALAHACYVFSVHKCCQYIWPSSFCMQKWSEFSCFTIGKIGMYLGSL